MTTLLLIHLGGAVCLFALAVAVHLTPAAPWRPVVGYCALAALLWEAVAAAFLWEAAAAYRAAGTAPDLPALLTRIRPWRTAP